VQWRFFSFKRPDPIFTVSRAELISQPTADNSTIAQCLLSLPCIAQLNWLHQFSSF
jgi:hypothetical protein